MNFGIAKVRQVNAGMRHITLIRFESGLVAAATEDGTIVGASWVYSEDLIQHAFMYQQAVDMGVQTWE